jgi:hypothetical protein
MPIPAHPDAVRDPQWTPGPAAVLFVLAPLIGEVLFGALPLSQLPFGLLGLVALYGGGALLVRETVLRRRLSAVWWLLLGLAYAILEEGLVVQSLFDQHYRGLDFLGFYGHWAGVNWIWALFIVPYHAVFSIAIPIALTELAYPARRGEPWLGRPGLIAVAIVFGANAVLLAIFQTHLFTNQAPDVSVLANLAALLAIGAIVAAALRASPAAVGSGELPAASSRRLWWMGLGSGLAWFVGFRVLIIGTGTNMPAGMAFVAGSVIALVIVWLLARWAPRRHSWTSGSTYALVSGALPTCWLLGFLIAAVSGGNPLVNLVGHVLFGGLMFLGLRTVRARAALAPAGS